MTGIEQFFIFWNKHPIEKLRMLFHVDFVENYEFLVKNIKTSPLKNSSMLYDYNP
jgi:hypothetical protein